MEEGGGGAYLPPVHDVLQSPEEKDALPLRPGDLMGGGGWRKTEFSQGPSLTPIPRAFPSSSLGPSSRGCLSLLRGMAIQSPWAEGRKSAGLCYKDTHLHE